MSISKNGPKKMSWKFYVHILELKRETIEFELFERDGVFNK